MQRAQLHFAIEPLFQVRNGLLADIGLEAARQNAGRDHAGGGQNHHEQAGDHQQDFILAFRTH